MHSIKILIVDNNILVRRALTNILQKYEQFQVFWVPGISENTQQIIREKNPDVVLLNIDDMESDGLTLLNILRNGFPDLPVIALTPRSKEGGEAAITALRFGAVDFITKPHHKNLILFAERHLEKRLGPLIEAASKICEYRDLNEEILESYIYPQKELHHVAGEQQPNEPAKIVVMGGCTGGPHVLFSLLSDLPGNLSVPIVIVQHFPRIYTKILAEKLNSVSSLNVREAQNGVRLEGGDVWLAPGGYHCEIMLSGYHPVLNTHRGLRENNTRPSIDVLFRSASRIYGKQTLGILLSGCGPDGLEGAREIRKSGGQIIVQDPLTTIAPELALTAIKNGLTREYFSARDLPLQILDRTTEPEKKLQPTTVPL